MAGTGYDEKQSGQLLPLEHHYKPFFGQKICIKQRKPILRFLEDNFHLYQKIIFCRVGKVEDPCDVILAKY